MALIDLTRLTGLWLVAQVVLPGESANDSRKRTWEEAVLAWRSEVDSKKKDSS